MEFKTISLQEIQEREIPGKDCYVHDVLIRGFGNVQNLSPYLFDEFNQNYQYTKLIYNSKNDQLRSAKKIIANPVKRPFSEQPNPPMHLQSGINRQPYDFAQNCSIQQPRMTAMQPTPPTIKFEIDNQILQESSKICTYFEQNEAQLYFVQLGSETPDFSGIYQFIQGLNLSDVSISTRTYLATQSQASITNEEHGLIQFLDQLFCQRLRGYLFHGFKDVLESYRILFTNLEIYSFIFHFDNYFKIVMPKSITHD